MKSRSLLFLLGALALVAVAFVGCADVNLIAPGFGFVDMTY